MEGDNFKNYGGRINVSIHNVTKTVMRVFLFQKIWDILKQIARNKGPEQYVSADQV